MKLISVKKLRAFGENHQWPIRQWVDVIKAYDWKNVEEVKEALLYVDILANDRVAFKIKGYDCRIVAVFNFCAGICFLCFVGTQKEYEKVDARTVKID